jgi:hypothetical protein
LEDEARKRGANAVVGLSIDFDELSAQGKSMFMLNALGTAVRVVEADRPVGGSGKGVDTETVVRALRRREVIRQLAGGGVLLSDDLWDFATSERIEEFTRYAVGAVRTEESAGTRMEVIEKSRPFFSALGLEISANRLFAYLAAGEKTSRNLRKAAADLIRQLALMDYELLLRLLDSPDIEIAREGLQLVTAPRQEYTAQDAERIRTIRERIPMRFIPRWKPTKVKGMFGKEHSAWLCPCGGTPGAEDTHCPKCERDTYGLAVRDITPQQISEYLNELLEVLREVQRRDEEQ